MLFSDLFVLELANNHLGKLKRGLKIIDEFSKIAQLNNVRAAIKLQFRDVDNYIHEDFHDNNDIRYIKKTRATKLSKMEYEVMVSAIKQGGCIPMATPFDEKSVDLCVEFNMPIIKIASSSINDWLLIEKIAHTKKPVIISTGCSSLKDIDNIVAYFYSRDILLAINHCVSIYPSEDDSLELNQIDFLKNRYPKHVIGFSSHEYQDWSASILIAYAKGARTFERHIDIDDGVTPVSPYCSLPDQIDTWFKAHKKAQDMCGRIGDKKIQPSDKEINYLDTLVRGIYAKRNLQKGYRLSWQDIENDIYAAIPLQNGQISYREFLAEEVLTKNIAKGSPILIDDIDCVYAQKAELKKLISNRGLQKKALV